MFVLLLNIDITALDAFEWYKLFGDIIYNFAWGSLVSAWLEKKRNIGNLRKLLDIQKLW